MPSVEHLLYIPAILLVGLALGFRFGAKAARDEMERRAKRRRE